MDQGIRAVWYDLPTEDKDRFIDWLHGTYLPAVRQRPGILWSAHYEVTGGGKHMDEIAEQITHVDMEGVGKGKDFVMLIGAGSPHVFFKPMFEDVEAEIPHAKEMNSLRRGVRINIFTEEARVNGPEFDYRIHDTTPGPAIQMGSFRTMELEQEWDLIAWYAQYRMPAMAKMPGCINTRKLISNVGWAKHAVMYEFTSLESRQDHFQNHESLAMDETAWTNKIVNYTLHAPGSPSIGRRIWPEVTE
jgi:hypothetical protein